MNAVPVDIGEARAVEIARQAIAGKVTLSASGRLDVRRGANTYVVTFVRPHEPGVRGADYDGRVTIDAATGAVLEVLGGS